MLFAATLMKGLDAELKLPRMLDQIEAVPVERYEAVIRRIARAHHVRRDTARRWFEEMVRFLDLCAGASTPLAPSRKVDKAWHEFLLFTREYEEFCTERYGRFVHHDPYETNDDDAYLRTYVAYQARFGPPPRRVWRNPFAAVGGGGACGGDGGGCGGGGCGGGS